MTNLEIARLLRKIAAAYTILGENRFKIIAYENAATSIEHATTEGDFESVPGVGKSIKEHLDEIQKTGKSKHFEQVLGKVNPAIFPLLDVPGLGPKKAYKLVTELKLKNLSDLEKAAKEHKIAKLENFGEKGEADILENIDRYKKGAIKERRMVLPEADALANELINYLKDFKVDKLGSLRRRVATIGDIDLAVATNDPEKVIKAFVAYPKAVKVIEKGPTGASIVLAANHQADLRVSKPEEYGAMLQYFTGSKYHNIKLREYGIKKGFTLNEYCISKHKFSNEKDFYNFLGLDYIPPELREDNGEIEAALEHKLPDLVELADIKGDLHIHSSFDLVTSHDSGEQTIGEIREMGKIRGYEYVGISNHNPSVSKHNPKQAEDKIYAQKREIEHLNSSDIGPRVLSLLEVDILPDGSLPLTQKALSYLDGAIAAVHSSFNLTKAEMTGRVLKALSNPVVKILAHPTGRLLGSREGYDLNWDQIFKLCVRLDKALEINAFPNRLDLPDTLVREAVKKGVKLIIGTDSHNTAAMDLMEFGVSVARRGWCEAENIINTWNYSKILKWLRQRST